MGKKFFINVLSIEDSFLVNKKMKDKRLFASIKNKGVNIDAG